MLSALEETRSLIVDFKLEVLSYVAKDLPLSFAVSKLVVPGLVDQLNSMKNAILPNLLAEHPQVSKLIFGVHYSLLLQKKTDAYTHLDVTYIRYAI